MTSHVVSLGSVIVTFDVLADGSGASLADAIATLQAAVEGGTLAITDLDGNTLTVDTSSWSVVHNVFTTAGAPTTTKASGTLLIAVIYIYIYVQLFNRYTKCDLLL